MEKEPFYTQYALDLVNHELLCCCDPFFTPSDFEVWSPSATNIRVQLRQRASLCWVLNFPKRISKTLSGGAKESHASALLKPGLGAAEQSFFATRLEELTPTLELWVRAAAAEVHGAAILGTMDRTSYDDVLREVTDRLNEVPTKEDLAELRDEILERLQQVIDAVYSSQSAAAAEEKARVQQALQRVDLETSDLQTAQQKIASVVIRAFMRFREVNPFLKVALAGSAIVAGTHAIITGAATLEAFTAVVSGTSMALDFEPKLLGHEELSADESE